MLCEKLFTRSLIYIACSRLSNFYGCWTEAEEERVVVYWFVGQEVCSQPAKKEETIFGTYATRCTTL